MAQFAALKLRAVPVNVNYRYLDEELAYLLENAEAEVLVFHRSLAERVARVGAGAAPPRLPDRGGRRRAATCRARSSFESWSPAAAPLPRRSAGRRRRLHALHRRHDRHAQGRDVPPGRFTELLGGAPAPPAGPALARAARGLRRPRRVRLADEGGLPASVGGQPPHARHRDVARRLRRPLPWAARCTPWPRGTSTPTSCGPPWPGSAAPPSPSSATPSPGRMLEALDRAASGRQALRRRVAHASSTPRAPCSAPRSRAACCATSTPGSIDASARPRARSAPRWSTAARTPATARFVPNPGARCSPRTADEVAAGRGRGRPRSTRPALMIGYYKDPEKTRPHVAGGRRGQRYVVPGDWARVAADGTIVFLGRGSGCINTGGEKVFPEEVEEAVKALPRRSADCLVVGVPDERFGEVVGAVAAPEAGAPSRGGPGAGLAARPPGQLQGAQSAWCWWTRSAGCPTASPTTGGPARQVLNDGAAPTGPQGRRAGRRRPPRSPPGRCRAGTRWRRGRAR